MIASAASSWAARAGGRIGHERRRAARRGRRPARRSRPQQARQHGLDEQGRRRRRATSLAHPLRRRGEHVDRRAGSSRPSISTLPRPASPSQHLPRARRPSGDHLVEQARRPRRTRRPARRAPGGEARRRPRSAGSGVSRAAASSASHAAAYAVRPARARRPPRAPRDRLSCGPVAAMRQVPRAPVEGAGVAERLRRRGVRAVGAAPVRAPPRLRTRPPAPAGGGSAAGPGPPAPRRPAPRARSRPSTSPSIASARASSSGEPSLGGRQQQRAAGGARGRSSRGRSRACSRCGPTGSGIGQRRARR